MSDQVGFQVPTPVTMDESALTRAIRNGVVQGMLLFAAVSSVGVVLVAAFLATL